MRRTVAVVSVLGTLVVSALVAALPVHAATSVVSTLRMTVASTLAPPDPMAGAAEWDPANSTFGGYANTTSLEISGGMGTAHRSFDIALYAPTGKTFQVGSYDGDDVYGSRGNGWFGEGSESCDGGVRFTIVDLATAGSAITRLDVDF